MIETVTVDPLLGRALGGRYLLRECLEQRGRLRRYAAESQGEGRSVVATVVLAAELDDAGIEAYRDQATILGSLEHDGCTRLLDFGYDDREGIAYGVEHVEARHDLRRELELKGRLDPAMVVRIGRQLLDGLAELHARGMTHGALCPAALALPRSGSAGQLLQISTATRLCLAAVRSALPEAEPYRARGGPGTLVADLAAVGAMLAQLLTGRSPDADPLGASVELPAALVEVVERSLGIAGDPFISAEQMRRALDGGEDGPRLGRYTVLGRLAQGGMGEILLARAEGIEGIEALDRLCVLKTIRTSLAHDEQFVDRFLSEARLLASLHHGNIVPVYDVGKIGETFYIAMEYVAGKDLFHVLGSARERGVRIPLPLALLIAREAANGLAYAHRARLPGSEGLVHRDVSPQNVLLSYEGEVKVIDFGLARGVGDTRRTAEGTVMGKARYLAPEQARGEAVDRRSDIYSLGLVLFEMLVGQPFFSQQTLDELLTAVAAPEPYPPSVLEAEIPGAVDAICGRAMQPRADARYPSAEAMRDDLAAALAELAPRTNPEALGELVRSLFSDDAPGPAGLVALPTLPPFDLGSEAPPAEDFPSPTRAPLEGASMRGAEASPIQFVPTVVVPTDAASEEAEKEQETPGRGHAVAGPPTERMAALDLGLALGETREHWPEAVAPTVHQAEGRAPARPAADPPLDLDLPSANAVAPTQVGPAPKVALAPPRQSMGPSAVLRQVGSTESIVEHARKKRRRLDWVRVVMFGFTLVVAAIAGIGLWLVQRGGGSAVERAPARFSPSRASPEAAAAASASAPAAADGGGGVSDGQGPRDADALEAAPADAAVHCFLRVVGPRSGARLRIDGRWRGRVGSARRLALRAGRGHAVTAVWRRRRLRRWIPAAGCRPGATVTLRLRF